MGLLLVGCGRPGGTGDVPPYAVDLGTWNDGTALPVLDGRVVHTSATMLVVHGTSDPEVWAALWEEALVARGWTVDQRLVEPGTEERPGLLTLHFVTEGAATASLAALSLPDGGTQISLSTSGAP